LLVCLIIKKEGKRIYYSLAKEKLKIFWQVVYLLFFLAVIHFVLKYFFPYQADKIKELTVAIDTNKNSFWRLTRIFFGLCIFAPIIEECIYRYFVFNIFGKKNPLSYLISFLAFILAHYC
jgi:membrane protease YdiL (CAAX protease family)